MFFGEVVHFIYDVVGLIYWDAHEHWAVFDHDYLGAHIGARVEPTSTLHFQLDVWCADHFVALS